MFQCEYVLNLIYRLSQHPFIIYHLSTTYKHIPKNTIQCTDMSQTSNARDAIARLLTTSTSPGKYSCGSELSCPVPSVVITGEKTGTKLSFPLSDEDVQNIKDNAQRAGVGLPDRTVVNLDVRKT